MTRTRPIAFGAVVSAVALAVLSGASYRTTVKPSLPTASVNVVGKKWSCKTHVNLVSVTVTIRPENRITDGVQLGRGCSGYIGAIDIENHHGDGVKMGFAHDLTIGALTVHCYGKEDGKHQDGVQVQSAVNVRVESGYIGCYSANNSQVLIHSGRNVKQVPTNVVFDNLIVDPAGKDDPTGQPERHWGRGGSYGVSNGHSRRSGFTHLTFISRSNNHDLYQGKGTTDPLWSCKHVVAGTRANWATAGSGC